MFTYLTDYNRYIQSKYSNTTPIYFYYVLRYEKNLRKPYNYKDKLLEYIQKKYIELKYTKYIL